MTTTEGTRPQPDITGMRLAHRMMLRDLERVAAVAQDLSAGRVAATPHRVTALARYLRLLMDSIHHHHVAEDDILWPVLQRCAGAHVNLAELSDDHSVLDPKLARVREAAAALVADPASEDAAANLALQLGTLRDMLVEHIGEEEDALFPVILAHVPVAEWKAVEKRIGEAGARISFDLPRVADVATTQEFRTLTKGAGPLIALMLPFVRPGYRRMERAIWPTP